jgi:hypothetical protein
MHIGPYPYLILKSFMYVRSYMKFECDAYSTMFLKIVNIRLYLYLKFESNMHVHKYVHIKIDRYERLFRIEI